MAIEEITADNQGSSPDLVADNVEALKALFPEIVVDGKVDPSVLLQLLGDEVDDTDEKFGLNWHGKRRARQLALTPSTGTLRPVPEDSVDWDTTQHLMIEGDNLEVLKLLQKSYAGRVKLIYIDPPYNTGKDFVYKDNFRDNIASYLEFTGQAESGHRLSTNTETSGRFHTDWLNMMYPRLMLARQLLQEEGLMFVSIGDEELHHLRVMCDMIFGEENFCGVFVWEKKKKPSFLDQNMGNVTDYIFAYAKHRPASPPFSAGRVEDGKMYPFNNAGNPLAVLEFPAESVTFRFEDQIIEAQDMSGGNIKTRLLDDVAVRYGTNVAAFRLEGEWRYSQSKLDEFVSKNAEIVVSRVPFRPNYINRSGESKKTANLLSHRINGVPTNEDATDEMRKLMGGDVMSYPKPTGLIVYLARAVTTEDDIIMDFFSGSGTTGHAVMALNAEDGGTRKHIQVQLPEVLDPQDKDQSSAADFLDMLGKPRNIAELTKERLRRAAAKIREEHPDYDGDLGFRVFKLDSSNIRAWDPQPEDLEETLLEHVDHLKEDRSEQDVLYELLLKLGLDLCVPIETNTIANKTVHSIGAGTLFACLDENLETDSVEDLALGIVKWRDKLDPAGDTTVVFRDSAFPDDVTKTNLDAILKQHNITTIRSI